MVDLLRSWGIEPDAVVGHSSGEIAAAYACGSITAQDAIGIAYYRGLVLEGLSNIHFGGMAAVGLGSQDVSNYLVPSVAIGCDNSPSSTTITGDQKQLDMVMENIRTTQPEVLVRRLRVKVAYHSCKLRSFIELTHAD